MPNKSVWIASRGRRLILEFLAITGLVALGLIFLSPLATYAQVFDLPDSTRYNLPTPPETKGGAVAQTKSLVAAIIRNVRLLLGGLAVFMIVFAGFRMVLAHGNEESINKQKSALLFGIIGLAIVGVAGEVDKIFGLEGGGFLKDPKTILTRTGLFNNQVKVLITFIKYVIGSIAVVMITRSAVILIAAGDNEEKIGEAKKNFTLGGLGLVLIILANTFINEVFFKLDLTALPGSSKSEPALAVGRGIQEIIGVTNFILAIISPVLILMILAGGILYVTSRGEEEQTTKAKKILIAAAIGLVIVYGGFAIVSTFISGQFG